MIGPEHRVGDREDDGGRAERDADDHDHREREHRRAPQRPDRVTHVRGEVLEGLHTTRLPYGLLHLRHPADRDERSPSCFGRIGTPGDSPCDVVLEVEGHLFVQLAIDAAAEHERAKSFGQVGDQGHAILNAPGCCSTPSTRAATR